MHEIQVKCPNKKCNGYVSALIFNYEGNAEEMCDDCGSQFCFHYTIEIDDIHLD